MDTSVPNRTLQGCRVLVVEDQYLMAEEMSSSVRRLGGEVAGPTSTTSGALSLLAETEIDLAILDINLDTEQVYVVADELRRRGLPFVFVTGYEPWVVPAHLRGTPHLEKPVSPISLAETVAKLVPSNKGSTS